MRSRSLWIFALAAVASHSTTVGRRVKPAILDISGHTATPKRSNPIGSSVDRDIKDIEEILASVARQQESPRDYYSEYRYAEARKQSGHKKKENRERNREGSYSTVKTHEATDNANHMQHIHSASSEAVKGNIISQMSREMETLVRLQNQQIQKDHANRPSEITRQVQNVSVPKNLDQDNNMEDNSTSLEGNSGELEESTLKLHQHYHESQFLHKMKSVVAKHLEFLQRNLSAVVDKETVLERKFKGAMKELKMREQNIKEEILDVKAFASQPGEES